jgi:hypothetical protein
MNFVPFCDLSQNAMKDSRNRKTLQSSYLQLMEWSRKISFPRFRIPLGSLRHVESGKFRPTLHTLLKMAEALDLDLPNLLANAQAGASRK